MYSIMNVDESKKVLNKIKDKFPGTYISDCVCTGTKVLWIKSEEKKVLNKMKEDFRGTHISECYCTGTKKYSIKVDEKNIRKAKGVKKSVIKKPIKHEQYKTTLFGTQQMWHGMNILRSEGHEIRIVGLTFISLTPFMASPIV